MNFLDYTGTSRLVNKIQSQINSLKSKVDALSGQSAPEIPPGLIAWFSNMTPPQGWLYCDGSTISSSDYPKLYAIIGTKYGGNSSNFKLPDLRNQFIRGVQSGTTNLGVKYGGTVIYTSILNNGWAGFPSSGGYSADSYNTSGAEKVIQGSSVGSGVYAYMKVRPDNMGLLPCIKY